MPERVGGTADPGWAVRRHRCDAAMEELIRSAADDRTSCGTSSSTGQRCPSSSEASDQAVESSTVLPEDLRLVFVAIRREPLVREGFRVRPRGLGVRIVARPHDVVDPDVVPLSQADRVLHKRRVHLTLEVVAGRLGQLALGPEPVLLPEMVGVVLEERNTTDMRLHGDVLQGWETIHDETLDKFRDR